jgi:membrane-bound serine protease (ClpP class)
MRTLFRFVFLLLAIIPCSAQVVRIKVDDTIHPISAEYISRGIDHARQIHADAVLIELRTPGGLLSSTRSIIEQVLASEVPVIVYVTPSGGYAASAGFFILQSADIAAMTPGTNTGAAHPVLSGGVKLDDVMKSKMENDAAAFMRSFVNKRGRNVEAAESAVRESKSFTEQEALDKHVIDVIAKDETDLLHQLDGRTVKRFNGSSTTLHLASKSIVPFDMTLKQQVLAMLMDPNVAFILLSIGMLALYAEFNHPGAVIPGAVGIVFILLAIFALNILPTRFAALGMILGAFVLFALEVKYTTHGAFGIGGTVLLVLGALMLVDGPIPEMRVRPLVAISVSLPLAAITIFLMNIALRARQSKVTTGLQGMIGEIGRAQTPLVPTGKVFVHGEIWNAICPSGAEPGDSVVVTKAEGMRLEVEKKV